MLREKIVEIATREEGVREAGGNNCGKRIREYQTATWLAPGPWAWCAAFCCWVLREALKDAAVLQTLRDTVGGPNFDPERWRCKDTSAFGWAGWAKEHGAVILESSVLPKPGDFVIFDFNGPSEGGGHIGIVITGLQGETFTTIEGNTNNAGSRDSETGDGVLRKTRTRKSVKCFLRLEA